MKKYLGKIIYSLFILSIFLFSSPAFAFQSLVTITDGVSTLSSSPINGGGAMILVWGDPFTSGGVSLGSDPVTISAVGLTEGAEFKYTSGGSGGGCLTQSFSTCLTNRGGDYYDVWVHDDKFYNSFQAPDPPPAPAVNLGTMISDDQALFASTTGFNVSSVAQWAGENLIKLFIGSGLAVIYDLRYWIAALLIIGSVIAFSYRAFRFFRH